MNGHERSYKFLNIVSAMILVIAFFFLVLFAYLLFIHDNPPLTVNSPPTLDKESYHAGDTMKITADLCRNTTAGATLYPTFINLSTHQLFDVIPVFFNRLPEGCSVSTIEAVIPHYLPPGIYIRQVRAKYHVNFLTDRTVEFVTEEFEILERRE